jgi:TRAP-type C4-dicarboxylate transport system permease small subunit
MENITSGLTISSITSNATSGLTAISPYLTLILGILLAFFIIKNLIDIIRDAKEKKDE